MVTFYMIVIFSVFDYSLLYCNCSQAGLVIVVGLSNDMIWSEHDIYLSILPVQSQCNSQCSVKVLYPYPFHPFEVQVVTLGCISIYTNCAGPCSI